MLDRNKSYLESFNFAFLGLSKLLETKITKSPKLVNLEVTKKCNARCDFCDYWQTQHEEKLDDLKKKSRVTVGTLRQRLKDTQHFAPQMVRLRRYINFWINVAQGRELAYDGGIFFDILKIGFSDALLYTLKEISLFPA